MLFGRHTQSQHPGTRPTRSFCSIRRHTRASSDSAIQSSGEVLRWLFLPTRAAGGSRRPSDLTARDLGSDLDQLATDWERPFLENSWNVAPLTNHGDNRYESLGEWLVHDVVDPCPRQGRGLCSRVSGSTLIVCRPHFGPPGSPRTCGLCGLPGRSERGSPPVSKSTSTSRLEMTTL
jgi:hypothetical protein